MRPIPETAVGLAKEFEGLRLEPYRDAAGFPTVGYGHLLARDRAAPLDHWPAIDKAEAERLLAVDLASAAGSVSRLIEVPLADAQYAALIDFAFNCGAGNLQASTLRRLVNREDHAAVPDELLKWIWAGGVRLRGLIRRRAAEGALYAS